MKNWMKITLLILVIFICVGTFYYLLVSSFIETTPPISRESYLELNIYGEIAERSAEDPLSKIFIGEPPSIEGLLNCIRKAKVDPKIIGMVIRPLGSDIGWAKIEELRTALFDFKSTGKPIYVYLEMSGNRDYYLSLVGNKIFGSPTGVLMINGFLGRGYFLKGLFDKIGVEADFIAHGKYKNAPDIFTRRNMSPAQREVINSILDDYYARYVQAIADQRSLQKDDVKNLIDKGIFTIKDAYHENLVDTILYYNQFKDYLKDINDKKPRFVSYRRYKKVPLSKLGIKPKQTIALIYGVGSIVSGIGEDTPADDMINAEGMADNIREAANDTRVKGIVLRIDSPGGSGIASDIIWKEVAEAKQKKPIVASMSDVAASGGYYIAMAADSIIAQPSSIVGSIGVFAGKFSFFGLYKKLGITKEEIPRGKNSNIFSDNSRFDNKQRQLIQKGVDEFYQIFIQKVAEGRNMSVEDVDAIAQGRVWTGKQAMGNQLIDQIGGIEDAINIVKKMSDIPHDQEVFIRKYPKQKSFINKILASGIKVKHHYLLELLPKDSQAFLKSFLNFHDYEPLMIIPFYLDIQ